MSVGRYSYINAKLRALKADILSAEQWDALLGARDMLAALRILDITGYADLVRDFDASTSPLEVERTLQEDFGRVLTEISYDIPESTQNIMTWVKRKFLKEIVKTLLRLKATNADQATAERVLIPLAPFTREQMLTLLNAGTLQALVSQLPDPFFRRQIEETLPIYEETNELVVLEHAVDAVVLQSFYTQTQRLGGMDRDITLPLVGIEIDLVNLMITLRSQFLQIPPLDAEKLFLEVEYRLPRALLREALQTRSLEAALQYLQDSHYQSLVTQSLEAYEQFQSLQAFEHVFHQQILTTSQEAMLGFPFHFGVILGFLNLKWYETLNLKAVMHGKAENLEPHIIRRALIL